MSEIRKKQNELNLNVIDELNPFTGDPSNYQSELPQNLPTLFGFDYDFEKNQVVLNENNDVRLVRDIEALKIWCYFTLHTPRWKYEIFTGKYGSEHEELFGYQYSKELVESEAYRYVRECLLANPYVNDVEKNNIEVVGDKLIIDITVTSNFGDLDLMTTILNDV